MSPQMTRLHFLSTLATALMAAERKRIAEVWGIAGEMRRALR